MLMVLYFIYICFPKILNNTVSLDGLVNNGAGGCFGAGQWFGDAPSLVRGLSPASGTYPWNFSVHNNFCVTNPSSSNNGFLAIDAASAVNNGVACPVGGCGTWNGVLGGVASSAVTSANQVSTISSADSEGYSFANEYVPISNTNDTVTYASSGNSVNYTSLCSTSVDGVSLAPLCSDINGNARPTTGGWQAGAYQYLGSSPTYTIGGTISGLSGTVVLQDNSGDNLTTSSNGSFTFATALNNSATYAVTVLTQPSGQTCTVTNGSGTVSGANVTNVVVSCTSSATTTITSFNLTSPAAIGVVNNTNHTVAITVPYGTSVTSLTPTIVLATGATISPTSGTAKNFTSPVTYTVTAADSSTQPYIVTVTIAPNTPSVPTNLVASAISTSEIDLSWIASTDVGGPGLSGYNIYRNGTKINNTTQTTYQDTGLASSTSYTYNVTAYDTSNNESAQSTSAVATTQTISSGGGGGGGGGGSVYVPPTTPTPTTPTTTIPGCVGTTGFSITTGKSCVGNTTIVTSNIIPGCGNRRTGFSTITGKSCIGNTGTIPEVSTTTVTPKNTYDLGTVTLFRGSKGPAVKELQRFLNDNLNLGLKLDGVFGAKTTAIVETWQKNHGLTPDGRVGKMTRAIMLSLVK